MLTEEYLSDSTSVLIRLEVLSSTHFTMGCKPRLGEGKWLAQPPSNKERVPTPPRFDGGVGAPESEQEHDLARLGRGRHIERFQLSEKLAALQRDHDLAV